MKIVFMGTPQYAIPTLDYLIKNHEVALVVTQPDKSMGRLGTYISPVKQLALSNNIPIFQPAKLKFDFNSILEVKPDIIVTAAYGQMIPKEIIETCLCINLHGSLLPKYRGGSPVQTAIKNGDTETGVTLMYMANKMDAGDIISSLSIPILKADTTGTLMDKLSYLALKLVETHLENILKGTAPRIKQDESKVSFAYNIKPAEEILNFNLTANEIICNLNSLLPTPGASIFIDNFRIKVYEIVKSDIIFNGIPGEIIETKKKLIVCTKDYPVEIVRIQPENKKVMLASDFLNGQKLFQKGDRFNNEKENTF